MLGNVLVSWVCMSRGVLGSRGVTFEEDDGSMCMLWLPY